MLIVSGEARSGTSMMMLVIKKLGININRKFYRSKADDIEDNPTARKYYNYLKAFTEWG